jgi:hypothetical protein
MEIFRAKMLEHSKKPSLPLQGIARIECNQVLVTRASIELKEKILSLESTKSIPTI